MVVASSFSITITSASFAFWKKAVFNLVLPKSKQSVFISCLITIQTGNQINFENARLVLFFLITLPSLLPSVILWLNDVLYIPAAAAHSSGQAAHILPVR